MSRFERRNRIDPVRKDQRQRRCDATRRPDDWWQLCVCWAAFLVLVKDLSGTYTPLYLGSRLFLAGSVAVAPFCVPSVLVHVPLLTASEIGYISFIVLVPTVGAYALNQIAVRHHDSSVVAVLWYLLPVFGIVGATLRLGEPLHLRTVVFALVACVGVLMSASRESEQRVRLARGKASP